MIVKSRKTTTMGGDQPFFGTPLSNHPPITFTILVLLRSRCAATIDLLVGHLLSNHFFASLSTLSARGHPFSRLIFLRALGALSPRPRLAFPYSSPPRRILALSWLHFLSRCFHTRSRSLRTRFNARRRANLYYHNFFFSFLCYLLSVSYHVFQIPCYQTRLASPSQKNFFTKFLSFKNSMYIVLSRPSSSAVPIIFLAIVLCYQRPRVKNRRGRS